MDKQYFASLREIVAGKKGALLLIPLLLQAGEIWYMKSNSAPLEGISWPVIIATLAIILFFITWINGARLLAIEKRATDTKQTELTTSQKTVVDAVHQLGTKDESIKILQDKLGMLERLQADFDASRGATSEDQARTLRGCFSFLSQQGGSISSYIPYKPELGITWREEVLSLAHRSLYGECCDMIINTVRTVANVHNKDSLSAAAHNMAHCASKITPDDIIFGFNAIVEHRRLTTLWSYS